MSERSAHDPEDLAELMGCEPEAVDVDADDEYALVEYIKRPRKPRSQMSEVERELDDLWREVEGEDDPAQDQSAAPKQSAAPRKASSAAPSPPLSRSARPGPRVAGPLYEPCPRCGQVDGLIEMRGRRVCETCAEQGRDGDVDYWSWHWHGSDNESLEDPPFDYQPEAPEFKFDDDEL